jgi:FlaA1/EpsC-like NDP-sugar epimerase
MSRVVRICQEAGVSFKTVPAIGDLINGRLSLAQVRDVKIEDLLGRQVVDIDTDVIRRNFASKVVLITGAGGSIGSELARQVADFGPTRLILYERSENDLFHIERELRASFPHLSIVPAAGDILDTSRLEEVFFEFRPAAVLHAAAYKHVPMMECQPFMAIRNNVVGTYNLASISARYGIESFLLISTDKAVNPTNVMGVTKRIAELVALSFSGSGRTRFSAVRFGNVLGSNGSVVPLFKAQIAARQPVTVTDPEVTRYFMTIPEAVRLVLQASTMGDGGDVFILDMGRPVKIVDLARNLIRLSGLEPDRDIKIVFTGLRPGEKRFEELLVATEGIEKTSHPQVFQLRGDIPSPDAVAVYLDMLTRLSDGRDVRGLVATLREIVPEYTPSRELMDLAKVGTGSLLSRLERVKDRTEPSVSFAPEGLEP